MERHGYRDHTGRYTPLPHRKPVMVRETVSGQSIPAAEDRSVLFRDSDGLDDALVHPIRPDHTGKLVRAGFDDWRHDHG